jgi:hypothetical protein
VNIAGYSCLHDCADVNIVADLSVGMLLRTVCEPMHGDHPVTSVASSAARETMVI